MITNDTIKPETMIFTRNTPFHLLHTYYMKRYRRQQKTRLVTGGSRVVAGEGGLVGWFDAA